VVWRRVICPYNYVQQFSWEAAGTTMNGSTSLYINFSHHNFQQAAHSPRHYFHASRWRQRHGGLKNSKWNKVSADRIASMKYTHMVSDPWRPKMGSICWSGFSLINWKWWGHVPWICVDIKVSNGWDGWDAGGVTDVWPRDLNSPRETVSHVSTLTKRSSRRYKCAHGFSNTHIVPH